MPFSVYIEDSDETFTCPEGKPVLASMEAAAALMTMEVAVVLFTLEV